MGFGALTLGLVVLALLALRIAEVRARNRNPRRVSMLRPVGEPTWNVTLDELVTAARDAGLSVHRRPDGFSIRGDRIGRRLDVERAKDRKSVV